MVFNSLTFFTFLAIVLLAYYRLGHRGQNNPILIRQLNPAVRVDMAAFLNQMKARHSNLVVVTGTALPPQAPADYEDLTHVNPEVQRRFTEWLAEFMKTQLNQAPAAPMNR